MRCRILQLQKRSSYEFRFIQDKYALSADRLTFALADGTTQSFNSEIWAEAITNQFVKTPLFDPGDLIQQLRHCAADFAGSDYQFNTNPAKASLERAKQLKGGTATLIGGRFTKDKVEIITCGDSNLFLFKANREYYSYPFVGIDDLDNNKYFLNTKQLIEDEVESGYFNVKEMPFRTADRLIVATDALSRLLIQKTGAIDELLTIVDFKLLLDFCNKYWDSKELQEDDISAIIFFNDDSTSVDVITPPESFSFPKEEEYQFTPQSQTKQSIFTDMEMNEIKNQFNGVANDFREVRTRQRFQEKLLLVVILLVAVNLGFYYISNRNSMSVGPSADSTLKKQLREKDLIIQHQQKQINVLIQDVAKLKGQEPILEKADPNVPNGEEQSTAVNQKGETPQGKAVPEKKSHPKPAEHKAVPAAPTNSAGSRK